MKLSKIVLMIIVLLTGFNIFARSFGDNPNIVNTFDVPGSYKDEVCIVTNRFPGLDYSDKKEQKLCRYDFYNDRNIGICPKVKSTNPAVEVFKLKGISKSSFENTYCKQVKKRGGKKFKKVGKFKQSMSCSYTPSIIGYYHVSKLFGGVGDVPPAVIRTMDLSQHKKIAQMGKKYSPKKRGWRGFFGKKSQLEQFWIDYIARDNNPGRFSRIYTSDEKSLYGALSVNPRGEGTQTGETFNGARKSWDDRVRAFKDSIVYSSLLSNPRKVGRIEKLERSLNGLQNILYLKEMGDMLVMDYILSQMDRFGNIHYYYYYYYFNSANQLVKVKAKKADIAEMKRVGAVKVKKLLLKDNDCGVKKANMAKRHDLLRPIRHLDPNTYYTLLWLNNHFRDSEIQEFFKNDLLFSSKDMKQTIGLLQEASDLLQNNCRSGKLHLDADIEAFLNGNEIKNSSDFCNLPSDFRPSIK